MGLQNPPEEDAQCLVRCALSIESANPGLDRAADRVTDTQIRLSASRKNFGRAPGAARPLELTSKPAARRGRGSWMAAGGNEIPMTGSSSPMGPMRPTTSSRKAPNHGLTASECGERVQSLRRPDRRDCETDRAATPARSEIENGEPGHPDSPVAHPPEFAPETTPRAEIAIRANHPPTTHAPATSCPMSTCRHARRG